MSSNETKWTFGTTHCKLSCADKYDTIEEVFKLTGKLSPSVYRKYDELEFKAYRNGNIRESGSCFKTVSWFEKWSDSWKRTVCSPIRGWKKEREKK